MKKGWDRALGESRKLFTLMRDMNDWIEEKWAPDLEEFDKQDGQVEGRGEKALGSLVEEGVD